MSLRRHLAILALFILCASCRRPEPLIGRWQGDGGGWIEYFPDGDVILNDGMASMSGKWKRLDDGRLKVDTVVQGSATAEVYQVSIDGEAATVIDSMGRAKKYQRISATAATTTTATVTAKAAEAKPAAPTPAAQPEVKAPPAPRQTEDRRADEREAQRQTVADIRNVGMAMFSWLTDQVGAGAAGQMQTEKPGKGADLTKYAPITSAALEKILVPQYIHTIPEKDGWGHPYEFYLDVAHPLAQQVMGVRSPGRDGKFSSTSYVAGGFTPEDFDEDIVWIDGYFVRWPQKILR
jgi:hypothetical protein